MRQEGRSLRAGPDNEIIFPNYRPGSAADPPVGLPRLRPYTAVQPRSSTDPDPTLAELIAARPHLAMDAHDGLLMDGVPLHADRGGGGHADLGDVRRPHPRPARRAACGARRRCRARRALRGEGQRPPGRAALRARAGAGADVVSGGELSARCGGHRRRRIVFSGVGKAEWELRLALEAGVGQINVESAEELAMLSPLARGMGRRPGGAARQPGRRRRHPRQDHHRPGGQQVRHRL